MKFGIVPRPDKLDIADRHFRVIKWFDTITEAENCKFNKYGGFADIVTSETYKEEQLAYTFP